MTLNDFFRYLADDRRTAALSHQLADAYRLQARADASTAPPRTLVGSR